MEKELLRIKGLTIEFQGEISYPIIRNLEFSIRKGEKLSLVGESGCGKTITALSIMGLLPYGIKIKEGEILFHTPGEILPLHSFSPNSPEWLKIRGKEISMVFQEPSVSLNPTMTVGYQIAEPLIYLGCNRKDARDRALRIMEKVGLPHPADIYDRFPHELSGGMQQRVMLAMALILEPSLLIADEPTTALDVTIQAGILELIKELNEKIGMAFLLITHDLCVVNDVAEDMIVMYAGEILEQGKVQNLLKNPLQPYLKGLIASLPSLRKGRKRLKSMKGNVPQPWEKPEGCVFSPRCAYRMNICSRSPIWKEVENGHWVRCWLYE
ncbi:MAG: ABC transporter ATP-binding protein [Caldiserica bacterium]|nr:ABC transporter ATP-binding protein [Caldisericota bacterium]